MFYSLMCLSFYIFIRTKNTQNPKHMNFLVKKNCQRFSIFVLFFLPFLFPLQGQELRKIHNDSFQRGEKISYRVFYDSFLTGNILAGEAYLEVQRNRQVIDGRTTIPIVGYGESKGAFNFFFKVKNRYETFLDEQAMAPLMFTRNIREGNYRRNQLVYFNHYTQIARSNTDTVETVPYIQDIISAFYYLRTYNFDTARVGDIYNVQFFLDDEVFSTRVIFDGREEIKTRVGTFKTLRFKPEVLTGDVFSQPYPMTLWISDDKNKIPILAQSAIMVGSVKMELTGYEGLRNPMSSKIK